MTLLETALGYARRARPVFPVDRDKRPLTDHGFKDATVDLQQIERWWVRWPDAGIGTPTGPDWFVLDDDTNGQATAELEARHGPLPPTVEVATPRPGRHLYLLGSVTNSAGALPDGLDVRGRGGYVVLPPSPHENGVYEWKTAPDESPIAPAPGWLLELLASPANGAGRGEHEPPGELVPHGARHEHLKDFAVRLARAGVTDERTLLAHIHTEFEARCDPDPPPEPGSLEKLAEWAVRSRIASRERARSAWNGDGLGPSESVESVTEDRGERPVTRASSIHKRRVRWTWQGRLALGYLAVWCGSGDIGKSLFAAWVIRGITHGALAGEFEGEPQDALIICTEDGRDDMWLPRLEAVGADLDRVAFLDYPRGWNVKDGVSWIDRAVAGTSTPLVFVDALMSHMPDAVAGENTRSPTFVRQALEPLADLCKRRRLTGLFGLHPRKAGGDTFADVVQESGVFTQLPRIGLLFGYHPDDLELAREQQRRVILRGKGNLGRNPGALSFRIAEKFLDYGDDDPEGVADGVGYITDVQPCDVTERRLLHARAEPERPMTKLEQGERIVDMALKDGEWHPAAPILELLKHADITSRSTITDATRHVEKRKAGGMASTRWWWRKPQLVESDGISDSWPPRATLVPSSDSWTKNGLNPRIYGRVQESDELDEASCNSVKGPRVPTHRAGAREGDCDCSHADAHRDRWTPHPVTGRLICPTCHPSPAATA